MNEYDKRVAKVLEMARSKAGISQERLAKRMGVSRPTIAGKEQGTSPTSLADIINWCVSCGVPAKRYTDACVHPGLLEYLEDGIGAEKKSGRSYTASWMICPTTRSMDGCISTMVTTAQIHWAC